MEPDLLLKIMEMIGPDELGRLVAKLKAQDIPKANEYNERTEQNIFNSRRPGYNGIPLQVSKMRKGVFGGAKNEWAT